MEATDIETVRAIRCHKCYDRGVYGIQWETKDFIVKENELGRV